MNATFPDGWRRRLRRLPCALLLAGLLAGCGGGGAEGGVGSGGTGSFALGPITGYGSILVNGVRYDLGSLDSPPAHEDGRGRDIASLQLGTVVRVEAGPIDAGATPPRAVATGVIVSSEVVGPVEALTVDATGRTLRVAGQTVRIAAGVTVLDDRVGAGGPAVGDWVEVYGAADAGTAPARIVATRLEPHATGGAQVRGTVTEVSATALRIGSGFYALAGAAPPAGVGVGSLVRLQLQGGPGSWQVEGVGAPAPTPADVDSAEIEGRVTALRSARDFDVSGIRVDAGAAPVAGLAVGARVEVEGAIRGGVLVARRVEPGSGGGGAAEAEEFEIHGTVASVDSLARTFTVGGRTERFRLTAATRYEEGTEADLVAGIRIEMRGTLGSDGRSIDATRIHFER